MSTDQQPPAESGPGGSGPTPGGAGFFGIGGGQRRSSTAFLRIVVGVLGLLLLIESAAHLAPAIRAGLHDGTRGFWVATAQSCVRKACTWKGNFVLPSGHIQVTSAQYAGQLPVSIHAGTRIPALFTGSGLLYPVNGSDQWISLLVGIVVGLLGLYWACHRWVRGYLRERTSTPALAPPLR